MFPTLFGFIDMYSVMILIGVIACFVLLIIYLKKRGTKRVIIYDILIMGIVSIISGIIFSTLWQNLYDFIKDPSHYSWGWGMTFYGGLFGGVLCFLLIYFLYFKKKYGPFMYEILRIAPICITVAHGFGRLGCLCAGCCYGIENNSFIAMACSQDDHLLHLPTQLFEAVFLFILCGVLCFLAFKTKFKYNMVVYLASYSIFRFLIEFIRGDVERGATVGPFYPSQIWCLVIFVLVVPFYFFLRKIFKDA